MTFQFSDIGERLSGHSGICELMDDLGNALASHSGNMIMMGGGNPAHIPEVQAVWRKRLADIVSDPAECNRMLTNYDPPMGNARFRAAVASCLAKHYGWQIGPENVAITGGGQAAFFLLFNLLAGHRGNVRRRILLPLMPEYIGYADQGLDSSMFIGRRPLIEFIDDLTFKYHIDFDSLSIGDDIAAIAVSRPTNPSGNVLTDDEVARLAAIANGHGIPLIIDNAYGAPFPNAIFQSIHPIWNSDLILAFSLSKVGLPGVRTGIVVAHEDIVRRLAAMTAITALANGNVGQTIVRPLLESGEILNLSSNVIRPFYEQKSAFAIEAVRAGFSNSFPYAVHRSEGAFFLWITFPELPITTRELYSRLKNRGVLIVPGEYFFFGLDDIEPWPHATQCLRMTYSQSADVITRGVSILADELRRVHAGQ